MLFLASRWEGHGLLIERYSLYAEAGLVLFAAQFFARFNGAATRLAIVSVFVLFALGRSAGHYFQEKSLRPVAQEISRLDQNQSTAVFIGSGFVESNFMDWEHALNANSYLYAPELVYPIPGRAFPLPFNMDKRARDYAEALLDGDLRTSRRILLISDPDSEVARWMESKLSEHYEVRSIPCEDGTLLVFDETPEPRSLRQSPPLWPKSTAAVGIGRRKGGLA